MIYIALKDNKIVHVCETNSEQGIIGSLNYEGITYYDQIQQIPNDYFQGKVGNDVREFNSNFEFLPLSQRKDYVIIPEGMKIEGEEFVPLTLKEKIDQGLITLSDREKYDEVSKQIMSKTVYELAEAGVITIAELKKYQIDIIKIGFANEFINGYFYSETLGINVDLRRCSGKFGEDINDLQNVQGLIDDFDTLENYEKYYVGYENEVTSSMFTLDQLESLKMEMIRCARNRWVKKRLKLVQIEQCTIAEQIKNIIW